MANKVLLTLSQFIYFTNLLKISDCAQHLIIRSVNLSSCLPKLTFTIQLT